MKIVAIANQKGGVGKTTTAVNLGAALAELGHRILLVDLDPQANATSSFGLEDVEQISLYEPLLGEASITEKIFPTRRDHLFIVPADLDLAGAEVEIARMPNHLTRLAETLRPLHADETFDFVLLDCPPSLGILMSNALAAADELLTPIQCEYFALEGLVKIVRLIEQVLDSGANQRLQLGGIVMTMFDARTNLSQQVVEDVRKHFGERVYETVIPRSVRLARRRALENRFWNMLRAELPPGRIALWRASSSSAILRQPLLPRHPKHQRRKTPKCNFLLDLHSVFLCNAT